MSRKRKGLSKQFIAFLLATVLTLLPCAQAFAEEYAADTEEAVAAYDLQTEEDGTAEAETGLTEKEEGNTAEGTLFETEEESMDPVQESEENDSNSGTDLQVMSGSEDVSSFGENEVSADNVLPVDDLQAEETEIKAETGGEDPAEIPAESAITEISENDETGDSAQKEQAAASIKDANEADEEDADAASGTKENTEKQENDNKTAKSKAAVNTGKTAKAKTEKTAETAEEENIIPAVENASSENTVVQEPVLLKLVKTAVVRALAVSTAQASASASFDNSTKMATGEYTSDDWTDYTWEGGTGKAKLTLEKIIVKNGKAEGVFTASSDSMTHVYYAGHTSSTEEDTAYYDPKTDTCGANVLPIENRTVTMPIRLNEKIEIACRTVAMTSPHWVQYWYTVKIDIIEEEDVITDLTVKNSFTGLTVSKAQLVENSVNSTLEITAGDATFTKLYFGTAAQAEKDEVKAIAADSGNVFSADVTALSGGKAAFYSSKDKIWHEGTIQLDKDAKTLTLTEGEKADYSAVEAARAKVPADLKPYKASRVKTLNEALKAVKEGYYASQQSVVDAYAEAIEKAIEALEKEKLTITLEATDKETGKAVKNVKYTVTDKDGKTVKAASAGVYALDDGKYTIKASAKGYEDETLKNYSVTVEETVTLEMTKEVVIPEGTTIFKENEKDPSKTNLFNNTTMFKVIYGELVTKNKKSKLTITLSASGYHSIFKGTFEEAMENGLNKDNWIAGKQNSEGKWVFTIPLKKGETYIPIVSISQTHLEKAEAGEETLDHAMFPRQLELDLDKKTLTAGDYDEVIDIEVISKTEAFEAESAGTMEVIGGPNSNNYACKPVITMKNKRFTKAFIGTAEDASASGAKTIKLKSKAFSFAFVNTFGENGLEKMFEDKEPIAVAFYDSENKEWADYKLTIDKAAATVTIEALAEDEAPPEKPEKDPEDSKEEDKEGEDGSSDDGSGAWTGPTDASTALKDGIYTPDSFRFSGGTGKVIITCDQVEVKGGQAYATIHFGKPGGGEASVDALRAAGTEYPGFNTFTIPVTLNANQAIVARTVAMSAPHWIEYSIFIELAAAAGAENTASEDAQDFSENTETLDETAPKIPGLKASEESETVSYTDLVKIFKYEDGYYLVEVNTYAGTLRDTVEYRTEEEKAKKADAEEVNEDDADKEAVIEEEGTAAESNSELIAELYRSEIIKYLVVPKDGEVPAGLEKEIIVIKQPADKTYVSSASALDILDDLGVLKNVASVGIEEKDIKNKAVLEALEKEKGEDGRIVYGGPYDDWDLRTMILEKTDLAISSSEILPDDKKTADEDLENFIRLGERAAQMDLALFVDRSSDEENDLAKAEWIKAYGVIYGETEKAEKLYKEVIDAASDKEKEDALKTMKERSETSEKNREEARKAAGD